MPKTMEMPTKKVTKKATSSKIVVKPQTTKKVKTVSITDTVGEGWKKNPYLGLPVQVKGRKEMLKIIAGTKGKTFTSTHIGKDGKPHTLVCVRHTKQNDEFGYIKVYSLKDKGERLINPQTLTALKFQGNFYKARK